MPEDWPDLTIGEVARRAGVATSAIRYYERVGLLPAPLRVSGQRRYGEDILGRLAFIDVAQNAGFTLHEIRELTSQAAEAGDLSGPIRSLAERKLPDVQAAIERAEAMKGWLEVARSCDCQTPDDCMLFPQPGDAAGGLQIIQVAGAANCRRSAEQR